MQGKPFIQFVYGYSTLNKSNTFILKQIYR